MMRRLLKFIMYYLGGDGKANTVMRNLGVFIIDSAFMRSFCQVSKVIHVYVHENVHENMGGVWSGH